MPKQVAADAKAAAGVLPQWSAAQIEEAFRRFKNANPEPKGELRHINPFTLLVAVVLSAQATDAGVNKATPALFALADTPEKMVVLGEDRVRELIKTIGLFRMMRARARWPLAPQAFGYHMRILRSLRPTGSSGWVLPAYARNTPPVRFVTSATILPESASISVSVMAGMCS